MYIIYITICYVLIGGSWILPISRPPCLRPMLRKIQYKSFAETINKAMSWKLFSVDILFFYLVTFIIPPLSAVYMVKYNLYKHLCTLF